MKKFVYLFFIIFLSFCMVGCADNAKIESKIINVEDIVINKSHAYCNKGEKIVLLAQVYPFNANNQKINWRSDNPLVAKVSDGVVEGLEEGRTIITAVSDDGDFYDSCVLYVSSPKLDYDKYKNNSVSQISINEEKFSNIFEQFEELFENIKKEFETESQILYKNFLEAIDNSDLIEINIYSLKKDNEILNETENFEEKNLTNDADNIEKEKVENEISLNY